MPHFETVFNGCKMVRRKVQRQSGGKIPTSTTPTAEPIKSPEEVKEEKKALRMKLQAELWKTL